MSPDYQDWLRKVFEEKEEGLPAIVSYFVWFSFLKYLFFLNMLLYKFGLVGLIHPRIYKKNYSGFWYLPPPLGFLHRVDLRVQVKDLIPKIAKQKGYFF